MKAEDTVMGNKKLRLLGQQYEDDIPTYSLNHYLLLAQAEITWKAAQREVVEWVDENIWFVAKTEPQGMWQAFKKEKGL